MSKADRIFDGNLRVNTALKGIELSSTPTTPASGVRSLYAKDDGWYQLDSAGVETKVGADAGNAVNGTFNSTTNEAGVKVFSTSAKTLTVYHDYSLWYPGSIMFYDNNGKAQPVIASDITPGNGSIVVDFTAAYNAGLITSSDWRYEFGNAIATAVPVNYITNYGNYYTAESMPMGYSESFWGVSTRPAYDASITGTGVIRFDYATAEYVGQFTLDKIPSGSTNLVVTISARPYSTAASGTNMGWGIKYIKIRDNTATTSVATQLLGTTAFQTSGAGDTTATYTIALSTLSALAGDTIVCLLYANTGVTTPKQTDWMIISVSFGVS